MIFKKFFLALIKKDHQLISFGEKNNRNINPLKTFHLPSFAMISLIVLNLDNSLNVPFVVIIIPLLRFLWIMSPVSHVPVKKVICPSFKCVFL